MSDDVKVFTKDCDGRPCVAGFFFGVYFSFPSIRSHINNAFAYPGGQLTLWLLHFYRQFVAKNDRKIITCNRKNAKERLQSLKKIKENVTCRRTYWEFMKNVTWMFFSLKIYDKFMLQWHDCMSRWSNMKIECLITK